MRYLSICLILLLVQSTFHSVNCEIDSESKESDSDYDSDNSDDDDVGTDQDFQFDDKKVLLKQQKNQAKDKVKEIYLSWDLDLCKDVECKENQVCLVEKSRKSAVCVNKKVTKKKKAYHHEEKKKYSKKETAKIVAKKNPNQIKSRKVDEVKDWRNDDGSKNDFTRWKDCNPCPVTKPSFYCGTDNSTYSSMCRLQFHNCVHQTNVEVACKGFCPCGSSITNQLKAKELRNHERWNKYMNTLGKVRRNHKMDKYLKDRYKNHLETADTGLAHNRVDDKSSKIRVSCTKEELKVMGERLTDWFSVVIDDQKHQEKKDQALDFLTIPDCPKDTANMFHRLDTDGDLKLSLKELYDLEHDKREKCLKQYLDGCDEDRDTFLNPYEWCSCFDRKSKPCLMEKSQRKRLYGEYVPKCDREGFYQPIQCHSRICWCVDRSGVEIADTRQTGIPDCGLPEQKKSEKKKNNKAQNDKKDNLEDDDDDDDGDDDDDDEDSFDGSGNGP